MNEELSKLEMIERYVNGDLVNDELSDFEEQLKTDSSLRDEVEIFRDITAGAEELGKEELAKEIKSTHQELKNEGFFENITTKEPIQIKPENKNQSRIRNIQNRRWWSIAATIALLLVSGYIYFFNSGNPNYEGVFAQVYQPENKVINTILDDLLSSGMAAVDDPSADSLAIALKFYKMDEHGEAQKYLTDLVQRDPKDHVARLYLGLALLQQAEYTKASQHLKAISQIESFRHKDIADWYLALSYMGFNSEEGWSLAKKQLKIIANDPKSSYQKDAEGALTML